MRFGKLTFVLTAACLIFASSAHAQTTLKYQLKEGEKLHYELDQKMKMAMSIMGMDIETKVTMLVDLTWIVGKVSDGKAQVLIKFNSAKMALDGPTGLVEVDSRDKNEPNDPIGKILGQTVKAMGTMEMSATMLPTGELKDVKVSEETMKAMKALPGADKLGDILSPESFKTMASNAVFPAESVTKGKTWTNKTDVKTPIGKTVTDTTYTYEGTTEKDGVTLDKVAFKPKVTIEPDPNAQVQVQIKDVKGSGHILFDNKKGRMIETTTDTRTQMQVAAGGLNIDQTVHQVTTIRLKKK